MEAVRYVVASVRVGLGINNLTKGGGGGGVGVDCHISNQAADSEVRNVDLKS